MTERAALYRTIQLWSAAKGRHLYAWPIGGGRAAARPPAPKEALCIRRKKTKAKEGLTNHGGAFAPKNRSKAPGVSCVGDVR